MTNFEENSNAYTVKFTEKGEPYNLAFVKQIKQSAVSGKLVLHFNDQKEIIGMQVTKPTPPQIVGESEGEEGSLKENKRLKYGLSDEDDIFPDYKDLLKILFKR